MSRHYHIHMVYNQKDQNHMFQLHTDRTLNKKIKLKLNSTLTYIHKDHDNLK